MAFGVDGGERTDPGYRDTILQNRLLRTGAPEPGTARRGRRRKVSQADDPVPCWNKPRRSPTSGPPAACLALVRFYLHNTIAYKKRCYYARYSLFVRLRRRAARDPMCEFLRPDLDPDSV